ncbi:MAG TPA: signal peptidase II [Anaerolineaceae bacterium]
MNAGKIIKSYYFLFLVAGLIILIDQVSKAYVRTAFSGPEGYQMWAPWDWLLPYARIVHITNTGVAFGMFQGLGIIFTVLALVVASGIIYYFPHVPQSDWVLRLSMSMMLGGALGNLIDRITNNGRVTDFISVGNFAVFNVADASITVGVIILILGMWVQETRQKKAEKKAREQRLDSTINNDPSSQDGHTG